MVGCGGAEQAVGLPSQAADERAQLCNPPGETAVAPPAATQLRPSRSGGAAGRATEEARNRPVTAVTGGFGGRSWRIASASTSSLPTGRCRRGSRGVGRASAVAQRQRDPAGLPPASHVPRESCALRRAASLSGRVTERCRARGAPRSERVRFARSEPSAVIPTVAQRRRATNLGHPPPSLKIYRSTTNNAPPRTSHRAFVYEGGCIYHRCGGGFGCAHPATTPYDPPSGM